MRGTTKVASELQKKTQQLLSSVAFVALACLFSHQYFGAKTALLTGCALGACGYAVHQSMITSYSFWIFAATTAGVLLLQTVIGQFGMPALLLLLAPVSLVTGFLWLTSAND